MKFRSIVEKTDPIGVPYDVLDRHVLTLEKKWVDEAAVRKEPWWKFWTWFSWKEISLVKIVSFILNSIDDFVLFVEKFKEMSGEDKKATVLRAISKLYDFLAREAMPFWLKPFNAKIKYFVVDVVASYIVDFIVGKYNDGAWKEENGSEDKPGE
jgi:hypothetical protein